MNKLNDKLKIDIKMRLLLFCAQALDIGAVWVGRFHFSTFSAHPRYFWKYFALVIIYFLGYTCDFFSNVKSQ